MEVYREKSMKRIKKLTNKLSVQGTEGSVPCKLCNKDETVNSLKNILEKMLKKMRKHSEVYHLSFENKFGRLGDYECGCYYGSTYCKPHRFQEYIPKAIKKIEKLLKKIEKLLANGENNLDNIIFKIEMFIIEIMAILE